MVQYSFTDGSALWQARHGGTKSPATIAAWSYIESRLQECDQELANARIDDDEPASPIDHNECIRVNQFYTNAHTHEGEVGFWVFPSEV